MMPGGRAHGVALVVAVTVGLLLAASGGPMAATAPTLSIASALSSLAAPALAPAPATAPAFVYRTDPDGGPPEEVVLENLDGEGTRLEGRYAMVYSDRLDAPGAGALGADGQADFRYTPSDPTSLECKLTLNGCSRFDAVNAYYHVDRFASEYWRDRLGVDPDFQAEVVTHIAGDGGFADPSRQLMKLGVGDIFMRNLALEDELIYHEYVHLIAAQMGFVVDTTTSAEARALSEGYADYFAASFTGNPRVGSWVVTCPDRGACIGPPNDRELRTLESDPEIWNWNAGSPSPELKYGVCTRYHEGDGKCKMSWNNFVPQYTWGMIWGSLLWDLRVELGPAVADRLAAWAMGNGDATVETFAMAAGRLFQADQELFGAGHQVAIRVALAARGVVISTWVESAALPAQEALAFPNPASGRTTIRLDGALESLGWRAGLEEGLLIQAFDLTGRLVDEFHSDGLNEVHWDVSALPQGLYFLRRASGPSKLPNAAGRTRAVPVLVAR